MKRSKWKPACALASLVLVGAACGSDGEPGGAEPISTTAEPPAATTASTTVTTAPTTAPQPPPLSDEYEAFRSAPTACGADQPPPVVPMEFEEPADQGLDPSTPVRVVIETSCGDLVLELDPGAAPIAVNSFVFLARQGYFDGSASHRIMAGFMFQAGDQTARGNGRPGYLLESDEWPDEGFAYERGVVAMANAGPGTTGSQFFIMLGNSGLSPNFTPLGRVVEGFDVLDAIAAVPVGPNVRGELSHPQESLYLEAVRVTG